MAVDPEAKKAYLKEWYQRNKAHVAEQGKKYREANKESISARRKEYRESERGRETYRSWRKSNPEKVKAIRDKERRENKDTRRNRDFMQKYGITLADYDQMFAEQDGLCAICFQPPTEGRRMAVDHNHETGKVRGLLCLRCNLAIGNLRDDPMVIASAFSYVEAHNA